MTRLIIAALITLLATPAFAADAPKTETAKSPKNVVTYQGIKNLSAVNKAYYDKAAAEKGVIQSRSGLLYKSLKEGSGASPGILSKVKVDYRGTLINGKEFNSTYSRKRPETHTMNRIFLCWQEGLLKMKEGGKAKLVCPPEIAFGGDGAGKVVPPNAIVTYEIELLEVKK